MNSELKVKVDNYLRRAKPLFEKLEIQRPERIEIKRITEEFKEMAISYYKDALHFYQKKEYENALAALEYAEGWLDAGKRLGIFR